MAKVFLSHSSENKTIVREIANVLGECCIIDEISFELGEKTLDEIFRTMGQSDIIVFFISDPFLESPWVKKELVNAEILSNNRFVKILPIIIDETINYRDERIPEWLGKPFNLKYVYNVKIIVNKIENALRKINIKNNPLNQEIEKLFVGRNNEMARFESEINNIDNWIPTYIIAYNYFEGIGRRTFLRNALAKMNLIDKIHQPTFISIDARESVENFIYKLNSVSQDDSIWKYDLSQETIEKKISIAIDLSKQFFEAQEKIFIIDNGGIVLANHTIVDWFSQIVNDPYFENRLIFCVISQNRPNEMFLRNERRSLFYRIPELNKTETQSLFLKLLNIHKLQTIPKEDKQLYLKALSGIPSQINYAVQMIKDNPINAKIYINDIREYSDQFCNLLLERIKRDKIAYQLMLLLAKEEIISLTLIYKVFGDTEQTTNALQVLYDLSCCNYLQGDYEYVKLNPTIADFVDRLRLDLNEEFRRKLKSVTKSLLEEDLDKLLEEDYSQFMLTIQQMLKEKKKIPNKYFIPSLIIKNVIREYEKGHYTYVIELCNELLKNSNYDSQILWETRYRLSLAYARTQDSRFLESVNVFRSDNKLDYNFLMGFYYRHKRDATKALEHFEKVLQMSPDNSRAKREKVNVLLSVGKYVEALDLAKENYEQNKSNIFHIHSYFISIIRRHGLNESEKIILKGLMDEVKQNEAPKADDILRCMKGEYAFYVELNTMLAINILRDAMAVNVNSIYPIKSLIEVYRRSGQTVAAEELQRKLQNID